jgi:hypothetical protein
VASGKELNRTVSCGFWKEEIESFPGYRGFSLHGADGRRVEEASGGFCHLRVLFKDVSESEAKLLAALLVMVASNAGERMDSYVFNAYGFTEIVIC